MDTHGVILCFTVNLSLYKISKWGKKDENLTEFERQVVTISDAVSLSCAKNDTALCN